MASSSTTRPPLYTEDQAHALAQAWEVRVLELVLKDDEEGFKKAQEDLYLSLVSFSDLF